MGPSDIHAAITSVFRIESAKLIAGLARIVRDVGVAEELAQDALVAALEQWPKAGIPLNPAAWLMATGKHRAIDALRHTTLAARKHQEIGHDIESEQQMASKDAEAALDDDVGDDLLRLVFIACHPVLTPEARVALTLRLLGGLTTEEIARAFLVSEPTIAQRIVRAKRTLSEAAAQFELPRGADREGRLASVLEVVYLVFNEGYSATAGDDWMRPQLCKDALGLGRTLTGLMPGDAEVHGLVALMELQASRTLARVDAAGEPVLLLEQNRALWDRTLIRRGLASLQRAEELGGAQGFYTLQAAIAACHARAEVAADTDWVRIADIYEKLFAVTQSPVVQLNRAVAVSMASGPAAGLVIADALRDEPALSQYHLLPSVRADLLFKLGRLKEAGVEFENAAALTRNTRERALLLARAETTRN